MSCAKFFSSYKSTVSHTRHDRSIDRQTTAAPAAPAQPEIGAERKDLLPWPIKTRKRGSSSNPTAGKEVGISSWGFTDLPPKKRILMAVQARRVDRFMCVVCGRVFEDYHALGAHKSQHTKRPTDDGCPESEAVVATPPLQRCWGGGGRRHCKVLPAFDINRELPRFDREEETSQDLSWYGMNA